MSLLSWFTRKPSHPPTEPGASSGLRGETGGRGSGASRGERNARRESLYAVVRECMVNAGVLSSSYKFKVLSLDSRGRQFLVMVDLAGPESRIDQLPEIEATIAQAAKARHDILVKAVYWRRNEHVAVGLPVAKPAAAQAPVVPEKISPIRARALAKAAARAEAKAQEAQGQAAEASRPAKPRDAFEPIDADEVAAFKQALASGLKRPAPGADKAADRSYTLLTGFEDTEMPEERRQPALSTSQYGDLR